MTRTFFAMATMVILAGSALAAEGTTEKCPLTCEIATNSDTYTPGSKVKLRLLITVVTGESYVYNPFLDRRLPHLPNVFLSGPKDRLRPDRDLAAATFGTFKDPSPDDWHRLSYGNIIGTNVELKLPDDLPPGKYTLMMSYSSAVASRPPGKSTHDAGWEERMAQWKVSKYAHDFLDSNRIELEIIDLQE